MPAKRSDRVGALLQSALAELLLREVKDPRIGLVTVTGVALSPDLRHARVFVSVHGDAEAQHRALAGLTSARAYLQSHAGKRLALRFTPELRFELDSAMERAERIEHLLRGLKSPGNVPAATPARAGDGGAAKDDADGDA